MYVILHYDVLLKPIHNYSFLKLFPNRIRKTPLIPNVPSAFKLRKSKEKKKRRREGKKKWKSNENLFYICTHRPNVVEW